jgi:uncharacterized ion transporter superfamily protein YfcC
MEEKAGAQISTKSFLQSLAILFALMMLAGILTQVIQSGTYARSELDGRQVIDPASFQFSARPDYPIWRWFTAPVEVLWGPDSLTIITIIIFLLMVGASFAILDRCGLMKAVVARIVNVFAGRKYLLLLVISLFFMAIGAFFGIFEEVVPLVPLMLALSYYLGWDALVGLGMSVLAVNMGFSAAVTNPFTIGVAQKLAGLPLFSGAWYRLIIFVVVYAIFAGFLVRYARRVEKEPSASPLFNEDSLERKRYSQIDFSSQQTGAHLGRSVPLFLAFIVLILIVLVSAPLVPAIADYSMPIVGLLFFIGGLSAGLVSGAPGKTVRKAALEGLTGISPAIPLILMAASIKFIVTQGGILDTILHAISEPFSKIGANGAVLLVYLAALLIEFFIASGSAKAFLLIPLMIPLADLVGLTRQTTVTAYCFGDGFSNLAYPTNPVLLICLGLTSVSYPKWLRWTLPLWFWIILATVIFLLIGAAIQYGPF